MQSRSDEFRAQAAECRKLANRFRDLGRAQYEDLARQWLELAERAERQSSAAHVQDGSPSAQVIPGS